MPFTFRVVFTGICTFVPSSDGKKLAVLLPDARRRTQSSCDTDYLGKHHGFLEFDPSQTWDGAGPDFRFRTLWELPGRGDLVFDLEPDEEGPEEGPPKFAKPDEVVGIAELLPEDRADLAKVRRELLKSDRVPEGLLTRILFERGRLVARKAELDWDLSDALGRGISGRKLAHEVYVEIPGVNKATVGFRQGNHQTHHLVTFERTDGPVEVIVANLCANNPLRWETSPPDRGSRDTDFKWSYELLDRRALKKQRECQGRNWMPCPIRTAAAEDQESVGGDNCYGTYAAAPTDDWWPVSGG